MSGMITTFYSYKGGVGRSFLLANVAGLLSRWGYNVLCVDWDIEAPGMDEYFRPWLTQPETPGLVELVAAFSEGQSPDWRNFVSKLQLPGSNVPLSVMTSGIQNVTFMSRVQAINWRDLYDNAGFGMFLEGIREQWKETYDFVLIDSRTGITDIGGICTVHLPDLLLFVFTANRQSLDGVIRVVQQAKAHRARLPLNRAGLLTLPIPSRFDARGQEKIANEWLRRFADALEPFYDDWLDTGITLRQIIDATKLPYFSVWTFGERLAVLEERENDPERISYYFATIAALLARRLGDSDQLFRSRDVYVAGAQQRAAKSADKSDSRFAFDFYVSYSKELVPAARELAEALQTCGQRTFIDIQDIGSGQDLRSNLDTALSGSRDLLVLSSGPPSSWQLSEVISFLNQEADESRKLIMVGVEAALYRMRKELPMIGSAENRVRTIQTTDWAVQDIVAQLLGQDLAKSAKNDGVIDSNLRELAREYISVRDASRAVRVARKDSLAKKLGLYVQTHRISHDELAKATHDGLTVALAEASQLAHEPGDLSRLLRSGKRVKLLHPAYRVLLAAAALSDRERMTPKDRKALINLLDQYEGKAKLKKDHSLTSLVATTRQRFENLA
jgi:cellulose biosynthesis protein BcsQ